MTLAWFGGDGFSTVFDGTDGYTLTSGPLGLEAPPIEMTLAAGVSFDGSALVKERKGHRRIVLPILMEEQAEGIGVRLYLRQLLASFVAGGALRYETETTVRYLARVSYESGGEQTSSGTDSANRSEDQIVVSLLARDPWWHDDALTISVATGTGVLFDAPDVLFDAPDVLFDGSADTPLTVAGDTTAQPVWTINGPYDELTIGFAGGQKFRLAGPLASGSTIIVDTRQGNRGPRLNGGRIDWSLLTPSSRLWELPVGDPVIIAGASGTDGDSSVTVTYDQRWLAP